MEYIHMHVKYVTEGKGVYGKTGHLAGKKVDGEDRPAEENYISNDGRHKSLEW